LAKGLSRQELLAYAKAGAQARLIELRRELTGIESMFGGGSVAVKPAVATRTRKRSKLSAAGRANIVAAQKARWAAQKSGATKRRRRKMSAEGRKKIAAAAKLRWATWRAEKKK
jgi:hypothetical protein